MSADELDIRAGRGWSRITVHCIKCRETDAPAA